MDNFYLEPQGFLGTGASLLADVTLLAYLFLIIPAMLTGFVFARRKWFRPHHKWTMISITLVNWVLILLLMVWALTFDVTDNLADKSGNSRYLFPAIHAVLGLTAQGIATWLAYKMLREDSQIAAAKKRGETNFSKYWATGVKPYMRLTLALWLATATLGILSYLTRYEVIPAFGDEDTVEPVDVSPEPGETPELEMSETPPFSATEEAGDINATDEPDDSDTFGTPEPGETPEN